MRLAKKSLPLGFSWLIMMWLIKNIAYSTGRLLAHWLQYCRAIWLFTIDQRVGRVSLMKTVLVIQ